MQPDISYHFSFLTKQHIQSIEKIDYGSINDLFLIKNQIGEYIGKFMKRQPLDIWEKARFEREKFIVELCEENEIPVPRIIHASGHSYEGYHAYSYMVKASGDQLSVVWPDLTVQEKQNIAFELGNLLNRIHTINFDRLAFMKQFPYPENLYWRSLISLSLPDFLSSLEKTKYLDIELVNRAIEFIHSSLNKIPDMKPSLVHSDFHLGNILYNKGNSRITAILDWEWAGLSDPVFDMLGIEKMFEYQAEIIDSFFEGYKLEIDVETFKFRKRLYTIYQQLLTCVTGYYYHNPDLGSFKNIENIIKDNLQD